MSRTSEGTDRSHTAVLGDKVRLDDTGCLAPARRSRRKGSALKNLAGALHADGVGCTLSVGREVKMEIPVALT